MPIVNAELEGSVRQKVLKTGSNTDVSDWIGRRGAMSLPAQMAPLYFVCLSCGTKKRRIEMRLFAGYPIAIR
jgi:hypothetical protein